MKIKQFIKHNFGTKLPVFLGMCYDNRKRIKFEKRPLNINKSRPHIAPISGGISQTTDKFAYKGFFSPLSCSAIEAISGKGNKFVKQNKTLTVDFNITEY